MTALPIGYARCSTDEQDLTFLREGLTALGVTADRIQEPNDQAPAPCAERANSDCGGPLG